MSTRTHNHTDYSNSRGLDCLNKVNDLIDWSIKLGIDACAITDHESLSGHFKFLSYAQKINEIGQKALEKNPDDEIAKRKAKFLPILGNEIYLTREGLCKETHDVGEAFYHTVLLAKDKKGWEQLSELSSGAWQKFYIRSVTRTPTYMSELENVVSSAPGHLIATSACLGSYLGRISRELQEQTTVEDKNVLYSKALGFIARMKDIFGSDFYLEVQPNKNKDQVYYNKLLRKISDETDTKIIIATDAHYPRPEDREIHWAYLTSQNTEREGKEFYETTYFMDDEEIVQILLADFEEDEIREWLENTNEIASKITRYELKGEPIIPESPFREKEKWEDTIHRFDEYENFNNYSHSNDHDKFFLYQIIKGLDEKVEKGWLDYQTSLPRIDIELKQVWEVSKKLNKNMSTYFTTMQGFIEQIWKVSLVAPGRGSAAAFLINFCLDITQVDPLKQDTEFPYWRFVSAEKVSLADIDIDSSSSKRLEVFNVILEWLESFGSTLTNIATFGKEKAKSALITSARSIGLESEDGLYFASMVPSSRGETWTLRECYYGDGDSKKAIPEFVQAMDENPDLWAIAQRVEGLIKNRGVHAAGVIVFEKEKIFEQSALMRSPKGTITTQFSLDDLEEMGCVKYDLLSTEGLDAIQTELYLLAEYGYIDWQENLKATYDKYMHPQVLEYKKLEMWYKVHRREILKLFQFDTPVGEQAISEVGPITLFELATLNAVMRLMAPDGQEMPIIHYRKHKNNLKLWYDEMARFNLSNKEVEILERHAKITYGLVVTQEQLMIMVQDPEISNFTFSESDLTRKVLAKKKLDQVEKIRDLFFTKGRAVGSRENFLQYIWDYLFAPSMGYSFSILHTVSYSLIAIQQMNLNYFYPPIFWIASRLMVESGAIQSLSEDLEILSDDEDEVESANQGVDYFKMGSAIASLRTQGFSIKLPDINTSNFTFRVSVEEDSIYFGLKGITRIGDSVIKEIINNRPYSGLEDFLSKNKLNKIQVTMLIKAGAFDKFGKRDDLIYQYCDLVADKIKQVNLTSMGRLIAVKVVPEIFSQIFRLNKHLRKFYLYGDYIVLDEAAMGFVEKVGFDTSLIRNDSGDYIEVSDWKKFYDKSLAPAKVWIKENREELLQLCNNHATQILIEKYGGKTLPEYEMEALSFYYTDHELMTYDYRKWINTLGAVDFFNLPEEPEITWQGENGGKKFRLHTIVGTAIGRDKTKFVAGIVTPSGFVKLKIYRSQFLKYDKQIKIDGEIEKSWFSKGTKLLLSGYRSGDYFIPKAYTGNIQPIIKILEPEQLQLTRLGE